MSPIARLPSELLGLVAAHCERDGLKSLRLTNHAFSHVATTKLFEELHISPNSSSFDRAHEIASKSDLSQHVRSLVYHFGKLADVYAGFDSFKYEYYATRQTKSGQEQYELNAEVLWNYNCWLEEIDAQRTFELRDEAEELCDLCQRLPRLEAISTILDEANIFGDQDDFIGKRTGMAAIEDDGYMRFGSLFVAVVNKPLRKISARSIQWHDLEILGEDSDRENKDRQKCWSKLKFLEIGIYRAPLDDEDETENYGEERLHQVSLLNSILGCAQQLETLRLDFDELPFESQPEETLPVSKAIFSHHWPRLRELKLEALCVYQNDICDFLSDHRATLTTLHIGDIELKSDKEQEIPSILGFFRQLREILQLRSCRITGVFTNRIDQGWYVNTEYNGQGCIRDRLEDFICGVNTTTSETISNEAEDVASQSPNVCSDTWLHPTGEHCEPFEDGSWQWAPELLPEGSEDSDFLLPPLI